MPTLDDLRAAFEELERQAPVALTEPVRPTHHRRWVAVGLAAACTAAVAVAVPVVTTLDTPGRPAGSAPISVNTGPGAGFSEALPAPPQGHSPDLAYGFAIPGTVAGYTVMPDQINASYQHASVYGSTDPAAGEVFVFYRDTFDASALDRSDPVTVNGADGFYAELTLPDHGPGVGEALIWQYAAGGWAAVRLDVDIVAPPTVKSSGSPSERARSLEEAAAAQARDVQLAQQARTNELALATAMIPAHDPARSPVRMASDSGWFVDDISRSGIDGLDNGIDLVGPDGTAWDLGSSPGTLSPADKPDTSTVEIAGRRWIVYRQDGAPSSLGLVNDNWGMTVTPNGPTSLGAMEQFVAGLQFAPDLSDPSTWFDAETALP